MKKNLFFQKKAYLCETNGAQRIGRKNKMANAKLEQLQKTLSFMFNVKIEITIRGLEDFTISFEGNEKTASIEKWLKKGAK